MKSLWLTSLSDPFGENYVANRFKTHLRMLPQSDDNWKPREQTSAGVRTKRPEAQPIRNIGEGNFLGFSQDCHGAIRKDQTDLP